jgi:hypothetical protein
VDEITLSHVLEHLGQSRDTYLAIISELYRICCHGAMIHIQVPHPRHEHFLWDPTHVRPITVEGLQAFDQAHNRAWVERNFANTPLGLYMGVDLRITKYTYFLDPMFREKIENHEITIEQIPELMKTHNNVCQQIDIEWQVFKE